MSWSPQQDTALKNIAKWLADRNGKKVFRLFGYAGTGKTTLAKEIAAAVDGDVLFMCYTGKASLVLRKKGCVGASTIHSAIYKPEEDPVTGITTFRLNRDSPVAFAQLVIVDEVSMVGEELARDLLSFGSRVLVLGDPAQLPPVKGEGFFINAEPDLMLTEIHRQAAESPIIRMSMDVREGRGLKPGAYGTSRVVLRSCIDKEELRREVLAADQLLCGMNRTRQTFNERVRQIRGMGDPGMPKMPVVGDRLVCLRNDKQKGLFNGGLWDVAKVLPQRRAKLPGSVAMEVVSIDEPHLGHVEIDVPGQFFLGTEGELEWQIKKRADQFTYGYALTVHKSQGSQWDNVLVFDESSVFREDSAKHLYTGLTRAAERVTIIQ